jgi:hypothetical protein
MLEPRVHIFAVVDASLLDPSGNQRLGFWKATQEVSPRNNCIRARFIRGGALRPQI